MKAFVTKRFVTVVGILQTDVDLLHHIIEAMMADDVIRSYVWRADRAILVPARKMEPVEVKIAFDQLLKRLGTR